MHRFLYAGVFALVFGYALAPGASAQRATQGFVVTAAGDTIRGEVSQHYDDARSQQVRLSSTEASSRTYTAAELRSYGANSRDLFISLPVGKSIQFVKPLVQGYASLYTGTNRDGLVRFYLHAPDSVALQELTPQQAQLTLHRSLSNCSTLRFSTDEAMRRYSYSTRGLMRAVLDYNRCMRPQQPSTQPDLRGGWHATYGITGGLNITNLTLRGRDFHPAVMNPGLGMQAGPYANLAYRNHFSLQLEMQYSYQRASSAPQDVYTGTSRYTATERGTFRLGQLYLPVLLRYGFGSGTFRPFLNIGPTYAVGLSQKATRTYQRTDRTQPELQAIDLGGRSTLGGALGAGVIVARPGGRLLSLEARYDEGVLGFATVYFTRSHTTRLQLSYGF